MIAESFARIFRQNMFNCGMLAVSLPAAVIGEIFERFSGRETFLKTDWDNTTFELVAGGDALTVPFSLSAFERALVEAGGWVEYADGRY